MTRREIDITVCRKIECTESPLHATTNCEFATCMYSDHEEAASRCTGAIEIHNGAPRCQHHANEFWEKMNAISDAYPDSPIAPSWFDPADAGEHWDDDY